MVFFKAVMSAVNDARIRESESIDRDRIGTVVGFSKGDIGWIVATVRSNTAHAHRLLLRGLAEWARCLGRECV